MSAFREKNKSLPKTLPDKPDMPRPCSYGPTVTARASILVRRFVRLPRHIIDTSKSNGPSSATLNEREWPLNYSNAEIAGDVN